MAEEPIPPRHLFYVQKDLRLSRSFKEFRERIIEERIKQMLPTLMVPAEGVKEVLQLERNKGAIIALQALLQFVDVDITRPKDENDDAP